MITMLDILTADELARLSSAWPERLNEIILLTPRCSEVCLNTSNSCVDFGTSKR